MSKSIVESAITGLFKDDPGEDTSATDDHTGNKPHDMGTSKEDNPGS